MAVIILRRAAIALAAYIAALLCILCLQFSNGNSFILSVGALKINGFERLGEDGVSIPEAPLSVSADGIEFFIEMSAPLTAMLDTGEEVALEMRSFNKEDGVFSVEFDRGISLLFLAGSEGEGQGGATIQAEMPEGIALVRLACRLERAPSLALGAPVIRGEGGFYVLEGAGLEGGYSGGAEGAGMGVEILAQSPLVSYSRYDVIRDVSLEAIAEDTAALEEAYSLAIETFAQGLLLAYQDAAEAGSLTQELAAAYLAESARQGNFAAASSLPSSLLNSEGSSPLTAPYIGGIEAAWQQGRQERERELMAYAASLDAQDPSVFEKRGLAAFLIANRRADDFRRLINLAAACIEREALTPRQAAGILELSLDRQLLPRQQPAIEDGIIASCEEAIRSALRYFPAFSSVPSSLYIEENGGAAGAISALETAAILYRWGASSAEREDWVAAARLITITALNLAERSGFLPALIAIPDLAASSSSAGDARAIPLAAAYPLIEPLSSWYPHVAAAYPRYSAWTCAENVSFSFPQEGAVDIAAQFSAGQAHYMAISGVQSFYGIQLHGEDWGSDPRFESYNASGYTYSADEGVIYLKLRHRVNRETIRIFTAPPPEPEPEVEAAPVRTPAALPVPARRR